MVVGRAVALSDKPGDKPMTTADRLALGRERAIEGRSLADLHREAVKLAVDIERERCARIALTACPHGYAIAAEIRKGI